MFLSLQCLAQRNHFITNRCWPGGTDRLSSEWPRATENKLPHEVTRQRGRRHQVVLVWGALLLLNPYLQIRLFISSRSFVTFIIPPEEGLARAAQPGSRIRWGGGPDMGG